MTRDALVAAFQANDPDGLFGVLATTTDEDRAGTWSIGIKRLRSPRWHDELAALDAEARGRRTKTEALFSLGTGPPEVVRLVGGFIFGVLREDVFEAVMSMRSREWKQDFAAASLQHWAREKEVGLSGPWWWENWLRIRSRERSGVVPFEATSGDYLVALIRGLTFSDSIEQALLSDRELLDERVWALFSPYDGVQRALLGGDRYWDPANTWRATLVRLALGGHLHAERLRQTAQRAAGDERLGRNQRAWYRRIIEMLDEPALLPRPAKGGAPPPGNRLRR